MCPCTPSFWTDPSGGSSADSRCPRCSPDIYGPAQQEMKALYAIRDYTPSCSNNQSMLIWKNLLNSPTYETEIQTAAAMMANGTFRGCAFGADCSTCDLREKITAMSLGDELRVMPYRWTVNATNKLFFQWLQQNNVHPSMLGCSSWAACTYWDGPFPNASMMADPSVPARWYYSQRCTMLEYHSLAGHRYFTKTFAVSSCRYESNSVTPPTPYIHWQPCPLDDTVL